MAQARQLPKGVAGPGEGLFMRLLNRHPRMAAEIGTAAGRHTFEALNMMDLLGTPAIRAYSGAKTVTQARRALARSVSKDKLNMSLRKKQYLMADPALGQAVMGILRHKEYLRRNPKRAIRR